MAPPSWAYQVEHYAPAPDEELVCSICRCVFSDPVQTSCHHVYCRACINKWLENNRNCPICRKRSSRHTLQDVLPLIRNMIMKLMLHCHNREKGCEDKFSLESCEAHMKDCVYESVRCKNRPCKQILLRKDVEDHEQNACLHRYVKCKVCCMKISTNFLEKHNCILALKKKLRMKNCLIKKKNEKIKGLTEEVKKLKANTDQSWNSSVDNVSAADILINLSSLSSNSDDSSFISFLSGNDSDGDDDDPDDDADYWITTSDILEGLERNYTRFRNRSIPSSQAMNLDESVEYPRDESSAEAAHVSGDNISVSFGTDEPEPRARRPAKRSAKTFNPSDNGREDVDDSPIPSPKRNARVFRADTSSSADTSCSAADSPELAGNSEAAASAAATASGSGVSTTSSFRAALRLRRSKARNGAANTSSAPTLNNNSSSAFRRTLSLLESYNLESDPEWLPYPNATSYDSGQANHSSDSDFDTEFIDPGRRVCDSSSSNSSISSSSSSSSSSNCDDDDSLEASDNNAHILHRLNDSSSSSDDLDWVPE